MQTALVWTLYEELVPRFSKLLLLPINLLPVVIEGSQGAGADGSAGMTSTPPRQVSEHDSKGKGGQQPAGAKSLADAVVPLTVSNDSNRH